MKKTLFNANFEESKKFVTKQYVVDCLDVAVNRRYAKYAIRFLVISIMASGLFLASVLAWEKILCVPLTKYLLPASGISVLIFTYTFFFYFVSLLKIRKKKMLYYFAVNYAKNKAMPFIWLECLAILSALSVYVTGIAEIGFIWFGIGCSIAIWILYEAYDNMSMAVYDVGESTNIFHRIMGKALKILKKTGWIIILLLTIGRIYLRWSIHSSYDVFFRDKSGIIIPALGLAAPLVAIVLLIYLIVIVKYHYFTGSYLSKYFEEYRVFYKFTIDEWYNLTILPEKLNTLIEEEKEARKQWKTDTIFDFKRRKGYITEEKTVEDNMDGQNNMNQN